ncbi:Predicted arabinose efflux permease, MFS family [Pseudoxanthomonas sp. GM95]|uniref:MFS transporter n=1 Tax=Pseudoxanthomonas sp. GM95 TaxID=1881043 RepID=UPI0008CC4FD2|nr:MFS transporter [Pseudoxanthomonas sp. GM95]SEL66005.1 Predicted arabinose efflux permease, MFS family [Pseudoxanthomonas sp. GM95]
MNTSNTNALPRDDASAAPESILGPRYRATTIGMVALVSLTAFEALAVAAAMPTVAAALDGLSLYALAFGGTLATSVVGMTVAGRWSDRRGPAGALWRGLACFVAGLLLAGLAKTMPMLIVGRLVQGLGAGALSVALYVLVGRQYPEALRPRIFAAFSAGWVVPSLVGPALSGLVVEHLGWRWVFLAVPVLAAPAAWLLRPALASLTLPPAPNKPGQSAHWAIGAAVGVCALYLGAHQQGPGAALTVLPALALLLASTWRLLPRGTLRGVRGLPSVIGLRGMAAAAFFGSEAFLPLVLSREHGLSPSWAGAALSVGALGWFFGSWYQGHRPAGADRQAIVRRGCALLGLGVAATATVMWPAMPVAVPVIGWACTGLGMGLLYASLSLLTLSLSPPAEQGRNSAALQLCEAVAVATALAVGGSLFALLLTRAALLAYAAPFAISLLCASVAAWLARRTASA